MREALAAGELLVAPGCYDALTAKTVAAAGLRAAYLTPFGFRASDDGARPGSRDPWQRLLRRGELVVGCAGVWLIVDAHTGIEGSRHVARRVRDAVAAGAAAVVIEDRAGFGAELRSPEDMRRQIRDARAEARGDCLIIVRSDAVREDLGRARDRCEEYVECGAELVMPLMTPYLAYPDTGSSRTARMEAYDFLLERLPARRIVVHSPHGRHLSVADARRMGFGVYLMPQLLIAASTTAMLGELASVMESTGDGPPLIEPAELAELTGVTPWLRARW